MLAAAHADVDRFDNAVVTAEKTLALAHTSESKLLAAQLKTLELFQAHEPLPESPPH
jgi:cellobiose-specific phosphotransferase system component IIA